MRERLSQTHDEHARTRQSQTHLRDLAARFRTSSASNVPPSKKSEGAGNAGRAMRPQPRMQNKNEHTSVVTTVTPVSPGIPRAMVLTAYIALSPVSRAFLPPSPARSSPHELDASVGASGPHDFAVRKLRPRLQAHPASTASRPTSVTIAKRPSRGTGPRLNITVSTPPSRIISENQKSSTLSSPGTAATPRCLTKFGLRLRAA